MTARPEPIRPDPAHPDMALPDVARPDMARPDMARPGVASPEAPPADPAPSDPSRSDPASGRRAGPGPEPEAAPAPPAREIAGWGRYPVRRVPLHEPRGEDELAALLRPGDAGPHPDVRSLGGGAIARGNGRAYGDSALGAAATLGLGRMDRMLAFDPARGLLVAEAGVILGDVVEAFLPRGWFPYVTPGTRFVTLGGAVAADVHGKNHHGEGSFGAFVEWIDVMDGEGRVRRASRDEEPELFAWTVGGMGLTGVILRVAMRLRPVRSGWIRQETIPAPDLGTALAIFEGPGAAATYSVAWIDCLAGGAALGRSVVMLGEHAGADEVPRGFRDRPFAIPRRRRLALPVDAPAIALNRWTMRAFNGAYWAAGRRAARRSVVPWDGYFYPLDAILGWNRAYGRRGFVQFQCVLPLEASERGLRALLSATAAAGQGSFLAVLKRMGPQRSRFSFPMEGYTLALDFPVREATLRLLERLDAIALDHGGRFYLAKDARMSAAVLHRSDPRAARMREMRRETGLDRAFASAQSARLGL
jgi:FAD/FMN-containing dehydrogenase